MRLNVHDFSGHPFQVQLSRNLAARGHEVLHGYSNQYVTGHGNLKVGVSDPGTLRIQPLTTTAPMVKYSPVGRTRFELAYARAWCAQVDSEPFDLVIACNVPLFAMARMRRFFAARRQPWIFWHQDLYSAAMAAEAASRLPAMLARPAGTAFARTERALVRDASAVVTIGESFVRQYVGWGLSTAHVQVVPNWAPLNELEPGPRTDPWSLGQGLPDGPLRLMYAGTLGRKHNPRLLLDLLDGARARGMDAMLIVVSEGAGADELAAASAGREDVRVLGYQPADELGQVLASADVLLALLEPEAGHYSIPSKVLSYLSAGRPIIGLMPAGNPAGTDIRETGGFVGEPTNAGVVAAASWLEEVNRDPGAFALVGKKARALAELRFDIDSITDRFEDMMSKVWTESCAT